MGYTTTFRGHVEVVPPLSLEEYQFFKALAENDQRDKGPWQIPNSPNSYCQWAPSKDGTKFAWDGNEKFYDSVEWMQIIVAVLAKAGHTCNGTIDAQGESNGDVWQLRVRNNVVRSVEGPAMYEPDAPDIPEAEYTELPAALEHKG